MKMSVKKSMKKPTNALILGLGLCLMSGFAFGAAKDVLQTRLAKVNQFYAQFSQVVTAADKSVVQESSGELRVKRPNLFNWHTKLPEENLLVSDGQTLWMYTPQVQQVTATKLSDLANNTLLMLITQNSSEAWSQYKITQKDDRFTLVSTTPDQQKFEIKVLPNGMISDFVIIETDGQKSVYDLSHQNLKAQDSQFFKFDVPKGVTLDDQRQ